MKALRRLPAEPWRDCLERLATDPTINRIGIEPLMMMEEFDWRTYELKEEERDVCWDIAECNGLLDTLEGFWSDDEDELDEVAA
jgi:hypothetical protein